MIHFPCHCGFAFQVQEEMAGSHIQCPRCGRLNDVPTLNDLANLSQDGTIKVEQPKPVSPEESLRRLAQLQHIYMRYDQQGEAIDHRPGPQEVARAGVAPDQPQTAAPPRYDPVTGELVRPMDVTPLPPPPQIPVAARATSANADDLGLGLGQILMALFQPVNIFVLALVFMVHLFIQAVVVATACLWFLALGLMVLLLGILLAHYGCTIDELGPARRDELPRPLRHMDWHDDLWGPFLQVMVALGWCYWVPLLVLKLELPISARLVLAATGLVLGSLAFPAVVLTSTTSGTVLNLRPDRVLGTIRAMGPSYLAALALWLAALGTYALGMTGTMGMLMLMFQVASPTWLSNTLHWAMTALTYALLLVGIYLMHAFCWYIGTQYRRHHVQFPWVYQRHEFRSAAAVPPPRGRQGFTAINPPRAADEAADRARRQQAALPAQPPMARPVQPIPPLPRVPPPPN